MEQDLYDEFGNYIGPVLDSSDSDESASKDESEGNASVKESNDDMEVEQKMEAQEQSFSVVLHEDKQFYPDSEQVFPDAEVVLQEEDQQSITEPIISPVETKTFVAGSKKQLDQIPATVYSNEFLCSLAQCPELVRNIVFIGHLHHGKTLLADLLIEQTLKEKWNSSHDIR